MRRALITGITGQDGSYLAELLLAKGYEVHGVIRRSSSFSTGRIEHIYDQLHLHYGDMCDPMSLLSIVQKVKPNEVYNLAAQSHVRVSFDQPVYTADTIAMGTARLLDAVRIYQDSSGDQVRFYQASSSEMFGNEPAPQNEDTPFKPLSPYACAKVHAHDLAVFYRESYGMHVSCGILFNHESPRRGETFVTRKITRAAGRIKHGLQDVVALGNLDAKRDWGYAKEYVEAMWLMLQQEHPDDYVVATGETQTVRDFGEQAFSMLGMDFSDKCVFDKRYLRPSEVNLLLGNHNKISEKLGWFPYTSIDQLAQMMVDNDAELARKEVLCAV